MYSPSQGVVYCFMCKLFGSDHKKKTQSPFVSTGFSNWKKSNKIVLHENSLEHQSATTKWLVRSNTKTSVNKEMCRQISAERDYWIQVFKRITTVVKFLAIRGLPLRGDHEVFGVNNNGNYLGLLELIADFDPFLKTHIELYGNKGKGNPSYLSKTICNEIVNLMKNDLVNFMVEEVKQAKYFSIIMDSTPDLAKIDQMAIVLRYCISSKVYERLFDLTPVTSHKGESIFDILCEFLKNAGLDIINCRGQSYDNASNMSGIYEGLQAHVKNQNTLAVYIPCTAHSLNLVGVHSVDCCEEAVHFFSFLQMLYNFFSGSTHRWTILINSLEKKDKERLLVLKSLSDTRWACHSEACRALTKNYKTILTVLSEISESKNENGDTKYHAKVLLKNMLKKETGYLCLFWNDILQHCNKISINLQSKSNDILQAVYLLKSLKNVISSLRDSNMIYERRVGEFCSQISNTYKDECKRKITKKFSDGNNKGLTVLSGNDKFRVETHHVIIDKFCSELDKRINAYSVVVEHFLFLTRLHVESTDDVEESVNKFLSVYKNDVDDSIKYELIHFKQFWDQLKPTFDGSDVHKIFEWMTEYNIINIFPNIHIAIRIYLTIPVANCTAERAFSKLARIKNKNRSTQTQENLSSLMILSTENDILQHLSFDKTLQAFATQKARKKTFI